MCVCMYPLAQNLHSILASELKRKLSKPLEMILII